MREKLGLIVEIIRVYMTEDEREYLLNMLPKLEIREFRVVREMLEIRVEYTCRSR